MAQLVARFHGAWKRPGFELCLKTDTSVRECSAFVTREPVVTFFLLARLLLRF